MYITRTEQLKLGLKGWPKQYISKTNNFVANREDKQAEVSVPEASGSAGPVHMDSEEGIKDLHLGISMSTNKKMHKTLLDFCLQERVKTLEVVVQSLLRQQEVMDKNMHIMEEVMFGWQQWYDWKDEDEGGSSSRRSKKARKGPAPAE